MFLTSLVVLANSGSYSQVPNKRGVKEKYNIARRDL